MRMRVNLTPIDKGQQRGQAPATSATLLDVPSGAVESMSTLGRLTPARLPSAISMSDRRGVVLDRMTGCLLGLLSRRHEATKKAELEPSGLFSNAVGLATKIAEGAKAEPTPPWCLLSLAYPCHPFHPWLELPFTR